MKRKSAAQIDRRHSSYRDEELVERIETIIKDRPTYGYRRVTAVLNRTLLRQKLPRVNHKRIYRIMRDHDLTWEPAQTKPTRTHDGKVIVGASNVRWSSDTFEIWCWDNTKVRVAFVIDCCDREVISWVATTAGINGAMIRDLMAESVEERFGKVESVPHKLEWLSDNGSIYTAHKTRQFAEALGLVACTTPAYSPESNGLAEAFVKTFKRDYVRVHDIETAEEVLLQLHKWFEDYNENHPHKGLKMKSPREFRRLQELQQTG
jgi:transposase InsO family protein